MVSIPDLFDDADLSEPVARVVRNIAVFGFQALWSGRSAALSELLGEDGALLTEATEHLRRRGRIELSADGRLIAVHGLSLRPTPHQIEHDDGVIHTWCALDAVGIPAALAIDARARTKCPTCQHPLAVRLSAGNPHPLPGAVLWYPDVACGHLIEDFCSGANLFCTIEHLERWPGVGLGAGSVMTIDEVAEVGREVWAGAADPGGPSDPLLRLRRSRQDGPAISGSRPADADTEVRPPERADEAVDLAPGSRREVGRRGEGLRT